MQFGLLDFPNVPQLDLTGPYEVFAFLVQFYVDDTRTPIEDTSIAWDVPMLKVAQVRISSGRPIDFTKYSRPRSLSGI
jgi:hypothetical protein